MGGGRERFEENQDSSPNPTLSLLAKLPQKIPMKIGMRMEMKIGKMATHLREEEPQPQQTLAMMMAPLRARRIMRHQALLDLLREVLLAVQR